MSYQTTPHRTQQPTEQGRAEQWSRPALLAAAALAASFFYVRSKARQAEAENPPQGQFIEVDGVRLHYLERGSGPPLVMLHGNGILANDFDTSGLLDEAAAKYRVIAFNRPGYGYSERPRTTLWTPAAQASADPQGLAANGHRTTHCPGPLVGHAGSAVHGARLSRRRARPGAALRLLLSQPAP